MRCLVGSLALLGCQATTTSVPPPPPGPPAVIQTAASGVVTASSVSLPMAPLGGGNLVVVAIASANQEQPSSERMTTDLGSTDSHFLWWSRGLCGASTPTIEVWTISHAAGGSTAITVTSPGPRSVEVFALEAEGMSTDSFPVDTSAEADGAQTTAQAPALDAAAGQLLVSTVATCGAVDTIVPGNPFHTLDAQNGTALAYLVAPFDGAYGAEWNYNGSSSGWDAHTDTFALPAQ